MDAAIRSALTSQFHAALATLREAIERCPDDLWDQPGPMPPYWQTACHAVFFAHLYLVQSEADFKPWLPGDVHAESLEPSPRAYSKSELLAYLDVVVAMVEPTVDALDLATSGSGFPWYKMPKLDHEILNIRHIMDHVGQLDARLRAAGHEAVGWHR